MRIFDISTGECVRILFHQQEVVTSFAFGRKYMLTGSEEGSVLLWDLNHFRILASFQIEE
jgi:hypothetical protein